jgi:RimJ/RimL family protein N-acetyltransferase
LSPDTNDHELAIKVKNSPAMTPQQITEFEELVLKGEEVDPNGLRGRIELAALLGYAEAEGKIVAVGAIKNPSDAHRTHIIAESGYKDLKKYRGELGYMYTSPEYRKQHLGSRIAEALVENFSDPVFSTTRTDNTYMQAILKTLGFTKVGRKWRSRRHEGKDIGLWIKT